MILEPVTMSGNKTASTAIWARPGILGVIDLSPPATGVVTLKIYDNPTAASGTVIARLDLPAGVASLNNIQICRQALTGIYAELSGTYTGTINFNVGFLAQ